MRENAALTDPAARLVAVTQAIIKTLPRGEQSLGRTLDRSASRLAIMSLQINTRCPSGADRARATAQRCFDILRRFDEKQVCDEGLLHKALSLADKILRILPQPEYNTVPLARRARRHETALESLTRLAVTGSRTL